MSWIRKAPLAGRLASFVGSNRRPVGERPRAKHYYVQLRIVATDAVGNVAAVELELTAAQVWRLTEQFPSRVMQEVSGIDRRQFMRAAGIPGDAVRHIIEDVESE